MVQRQEVVERDVEHARDLAGVFVGAELVLDKALIIRRSRRLLSKGWLRKQDCGSKRNEMGNSPNAAR